MSLPDESQVADLEGVKKDHLILGMLAVMGGENAEINERDLFLDCWHAFPNAMRWVDTALPNPDTFTAALRRLDAQKLIVRKGKQARSKRRKTVRKVYDAGRSGVVRARLADDALERAGITPDRLAAIRQLAPDQPLARRADDAELIALCIALRAEHGRNVEEGALVETAFHKFPARFAYAERREFPDVEAIRSALSKARHRHLIDSANGLTNEGKTVVGDLQGVGGARLDTSGAHAAGALKLADQISKSQGFEVYAESGSLVATKGDELFRLLRTPPVADPQPIANALTLRLKELRRVDRDDLASYLLAVAEKHNPDVLELLSDGATAQAGR